jgi:hypothetical protein
MMPALLLALHGDRLELAYFWSSIVIVALPIGVFVTIAVLAVRGYFRRQVPDGGGEVGPTPPAPSQSPPK